MYQNFIPKKDKIIIKRKATNVIIGIVIYPNSKKKYSEQDTEFPKAEQGI